MTDAFEFRFRVRYPECDAQGVVFNARYGDYTDLAVTEFWRVLMGGYEAMRSTGYETQVVRLLTQWQGPARFDEVLHARVQCQHLGNTSFTLQVVFTHESGRPVAVTDITYVLVDAHSFEKRALPEELRIQLAQGAPGRRVDQSGSAY